MARSLDAGAFAQHYCSYESDDKARIGERKLINSLKDDEKFEDPHFKADGTALYYDPLHPPKYGILQTWSIGREYPRWAPSRA